MREIRYSPRGRDELEDILEQIAIVSPSGSRNVARRISSFIADLPTFPFKGRQTANPDIRRMNARPYPYLIFYQVLDEEIVIHSVTHGARDPDEMPGSDGPAGP